MAEDFDRHLSRMSTLWSLVGRAHGGPPAEVRSAQEKMLERYGNAIRRYLSAALRDSDQVDEVYQEFAHMFVRGGLGGANPHVGRFRDYLKTALYHLIAAHARRQKRHGAEPLEGNPEPAVGSLSFVDSDREFLVSWRKELLARTWTALQAIEQETARPLYTVLRFRADHPDLRSTEMAVQLGSQRGVSMTAAGVRQTLHRARTKFAALLVEEVMDALDQPTEADLIEELIELDLLEYCKPVLPSYQA